MGITRTLLQEKSNFTKGRSTSSETEKKENKLKERKGKRKGKEKGKRKGKENLRKQQDQAATPSKMNLLHMGGYAV